MHGSTGDIVFLGTKTDELEPIFAELTAAGFDLGGSGSCLRTPSACVGQARCEYACYDTLKVCNDLTQAYQDELHRPPFPYKFKIKCSGCPNDCVAAAARADLSIIGMWKDDIQQDDAAVTEYAAGGLDIQKNVCDQCPSRCMSWDGEKLAIENHECVRCMHCINMMPKALRPGKERGATLLIGSKAPIVQGALLSSVLVPFVPADELLDTVQELNRRIWEFWDEHGKNRERVGELIQRVGMANFLDGIGLDPVPEMVSAPARQPVHLLPERGGEMTPKPKRITDIGPPSYEKFLPPVIQRNYGLWKYHEFVSPGILCHVAESGEKMYTVRAGSPRLLSVHTIRLFADLADKYCGGYLRFTSRNNVEFLLDNFANVAPLKAEVEAAGYPVGRHPAAPSATSCTRRAGSIATPRPPTPPAWSRA